MPKFNVTSSFSLYTELSPEVNTYRVGGDYDDFSDNSYFETETIEVSGGEFTYTLVAEDEGDAERKANEIVYDGQEFEDNNGFTWGATNVDHSIEAVELSKEEALAIIRRLLDRLAAAGSLTSEEREAFDVILQDV